MRTFSLFCQFVFLISVTAQRSDHNDRIFPPFSQNTRELHLKYGSDIDEKIIEMEAKSVIAIRAVGVPRDVAFAIFQAHSQRHPVVMSYNQTLSISNHVNGTNVGLHVPIHDIENSVIFLLNPQPFKIKVLTFIMFYDRTVPIPGGCNLEFEVETAPWLKVSYDANTISVDHAPAARPLSRLGVSPSCDTAEEGLHYEVFHSYISQRDFSEESYFNAIRMLRTPEDAHQNGREIRLFGYTPTTRSQFSLYPGVGQVFVVTVANLAYDSFQTAAYVPAVSYGCDLNQEEDCLPMSSTWGKVFCAFGLFIGLFLTFLGHRYFQIEMFLIGFITFAAVSYVVLINQINPDQAGLMAGTSVMGLLGGIVWWFVWWYWGIPAVSVLPVIFLLGFLTASVFFYLPISFEFLTHDLNFWSAFACCWLVVPVVCVTVTRMGNIVSCAVLGGYGVVLPVDFYIGSSLKYIVLNVIRRATVHGFGRVVLDPPYQDNDWILSSVWLALAICGIVFQYIRERKRPPFSPPGEMWRPAGPAGPDRPGPTSTERTPLMADSANGPGRYGSTI